MKLHIQFQFYGVLTTATRLLQYFLDNYFLWLHIYNKSFDVNWWTKVFPEERRPSRSWAVQIHFQPDTVTTLCLTYRGWVVIWSALLHIKFNYIYFCLKLDFSFKKYKKEFKGKKSGSRLVYVFISFRTILSIFIKKYILINVNLAHFLFQTQS